MQTANAETQQAFFTCGGQTIDNWTLVLITLMLFTPYFHGIVTSFG